MDFIVASSNGVWVNIVLACLPVIIGLFLGYKAKSDKSDIMVDVEKKISEELDPIEKRMDKHDTDFKEFKRDEIEPMKKDIHDLITKQSVIDNKVDTIKEGIGDLKEGIGDLKDLFKTVFKKLDQKKDK